MSNFDPNVNQTEIDRLNQDLYLVIPASASEDSIALWEELFECIRGEYLAGGIAPSAVQEILQNFGSLDSVGKENYLEGYYDNLEAQLGIENIDETVQEEDVMTLEEYESELAKIAQTVPEEFRNLFYYVHYTQSLGEEMDPEIAKIWADIQAGKAPDYLAQIKLQEALDKRKTLDLQNEDPKNQRKFNTVMRPEDIEKMLDVKFDS